MKLFSNFSASLNKLIARKGVDTYSLLCWQSANANAPACTALTDADVSESDAVNSVVATVSCTDADDANTPEGMVRYSMTGGDGYFAIGSLSGQTPKYSHTAMYYIGAVSFEITCEKRHLNSEFRRLWKI